ncbi:MAG TPA: CBS domain-containing protein, partial [Bryobacteraceae bacterium]|nr:CBS domain-containing protein [Bryobacteraceae bacterium]
MRSCNDVMTPDPTCCAAGDAATRAAEIMKLEDVGAVPVVDEQTSKKLVGIITDRDLVLNVLAEGKDANSCRIEDLMSRNPVTCRPDEDVQNAMDRMAQHQVRRIPVVDGKGRVVGIISQADIATRIDLPERTANVLEDISQP